MQRALSQPPLRACSVAWSCSCSGAILIATDVIDTGDTTREVVRAGAARAAGADDAVDERA